ncbi:MAG TPA: FG-GAP-like repeat-containing protein [Gemmatimonadaceae bacterium]
MQLTRRRRSLLITMGAAVLFVAVSTIAAVRWMHGGPTYKPGEDVEGVTADLARTLPLDYPRVHFSDVTKDAHIDFRHFDGKRGSWLPEDMGSGAAWGDYDGDGWVDLVVANEAGSIDRSDDERRRSPARLTLYHNEHDGTFRDVTDRAGIDQRGSLMGVAWADYDDDGHLDLVVTAYGHNTLYHGNGDGTFTDVSAESGIGAPEGFWAGAAWGDYDKDGRLDLFVTGYVKFSKRSTTTGVSGKYDVENPASINPLAFPPERNLLFHNDGNGKFTERAAAAGVVDLDGRGLSASWVDLDEDGWLDLYVANDVSRNVLYRNRHDGTFEDVAEVAHVSDYRSSMGIAVGDWNGDGAQDLFLTHWLAQGNALYDNQLHRPHEGTKRAPLGFMDEADRYGLGQQSLDFVGWATSFIDYDNDGKLDLFVVNGSTLQKRDDPSSMVPMQSRLFWNRGTREGFFDVSPVGGRYFGTQYVGRGAAFADYDNDGDIDVFVVNHGGSGVLLRNDGGNKNSWLEVELRGAKGNRQGLGATIRVVVAGEAQVRQVGAQAPYLSQNSPIEEFGLGAHARVDTVEVRWLDGTRDVRVGVTAKQRLVITEGEAAARVESGVQTPRIPPLARDDDWRMSRQGVRPQRGLTPDEGLAPSGPSAVSAASGMTDRERVQRFWTIYREASAYRIAKDASRAAATYARALELNPQHEDALYYMGSMRLELGEFAGAADAWRRLVGVNANSARTHSQLGALYMCLDQGAPFQLDTAEAHLRRAHEINKEENGPLLRLAEVALLRGDRASAQRDLTAVLRNDTGNATAHFYTGYLALRNKDLTRAREELGKASKAPLTPPLPQGAASGEGDTKAGAKLGHESVHCDQLRAAARRAKELGDKVDPGERYRELESVLTSARRRG